MSERATGRISSGSSRSSGATTPENVFHVDQNIPPGADRPYGAGMTTALVTGASAGLGAEFCRQLAAGGHDIVLVARHRAALQALAEELTARHGIRTEVLPADLADRDQLEAVARRLGDDGAADGAGPVDLLVNNAGFGLSTSFLDSEVTAEERALDVMCRAVLVLSHAAGRAMAARGHGGIINVSSVASFVAMGSYSAAKAWVTTFSEGLAAELAPRGVVVTALCPGFTHTQFHERARLDMSRLPEGMWLTAADVVAAGLADARRGRVISVPGAQYKALTGLLAILPRRLRRSASSGLASRRRAGWRRR